MFNWRLVFPLRSRNQPTWVASLEEERGTFWVWPEPENRCLRMLLSKTGECRKSADQTFLDSHMEIGHWLAKGWKERTFSELCEAVPGIEEVFV